MSDCASLWQSELQRELEHKNSMQQVKLFLYCTEILINILGFIFSLHQAVMNSDIYYTADIFFLLRFPAAQKTMDILTLEIQLPLCQT